MMTNSKETNMKKKRTFSVKFALAVLGMVLGIGGAGIAWFSHTKPETHYSTVRRIYVMTEQIKKAVMIYAMRHDIKFPDSLDELAQFAFGSTYGNEPLLTKEDLIDPWGMPFEYERDGFKYIIRSSGPDKIMGTKDDIIEGYPASHVTRWQAKLMQAVDRQETSAVQTATPDPVTPPPPPAAAEPQPAATVEPPPAAVGTETSRCASPPEQEQNESATNKGTPWKLPLLIGVAAAVALAAWLRFRKK